MPLLRTSSPRPAALAGGPRPFPQTYRRYLLVRYEHVGGSSHTFACVSLLSSMRTREREPGAELSRRVRSEITESSLADCDGPKGTDWNSIEQYSSTPAGVLTEPYLCSATAGVGTLELECRPQRAKDVMKAMFVAMRFGLG